MSSADDYRRHAAECLALAQRISDPQDKTTMLQMAEAWRRLAERAENQQKAGEA